MNVVKFSAKGLNLFNGQLTIEASFKIASKSVKKLHYFSGYFLLISSIQLTLRVTCFGFIFRELTLITTSPRSLLTRYATFIKPVSQFFFLKRERRIIMTYTLRSCWLYNLKLICFCLC